MIEQGQVINLTDGEYSDYYIAGTYKARRAFDMYSAESYFKKTEEPMSRNVNSGQWCWCTDDFVKFLLNHGFIEKIDALEIFLGGYGQLKIEI